MKSAAPLEQWIVLPSMNQSWCTPRDRGPERSMKLMLRGCSGVEMSNSSIPAGVAPCVPVWYATAMMLSHTSSEFDRTLRCGRSVCTMTRGFVGSVTSTPVKFFGAHSCAIHMMRRPPEASCRLMPSPTLPKPLIVSCEIRRKLWASGCAMRVSP